MVTVALFHSALGLRPAVHTFAEQLRGAGHTVWVPDLFDGEVFDDLDAGVAKRDALGIGELMRRACAAVEDLPADTVYAGFSMGAAAAQLLAATRPGARGAVLIQGALPVAAFGIDAWPAVPVQLHTTTADPWLDQADVDAFLASVPAGFCELHRYEGSGHLVSDAAWTDHDPATAQQIERRVLGWLAGARPVASDQHSQAG